MTQIEEKFIKSLVEELKDFAETCTSKKKIDIPFVISPLVQVFSTQNADKFADDLEQWCDYNIRIEYPSEEDYYTSLIVRVNLAEFSENHYPNDVDYPNYNYILRFGYDERNYGYCECRLGDEDYREDKGCCGHGCDWYAPTVSIFKELNIVSQNWSGDEHDYWDFEDNFYKSDKELALEKEKIDIEEKIKCVKENIESFQEQLNILLSQVGEI